MPQIKNQIEKFWSYTPKKLFKKLQTKKSGLTKHAAANRLKIYGRNVIKPKKEFKWWSLLLSQFKNPLILILMAASIFSMLMREWFDAGMVLLVIFGSALLTFFQEFAAKNAVAKLQSRLKIKIKTLRSGRQCLVPNEDIVPGDVVLLAAGALIPGDGVILEAEDLHVNQASLTGETFPVLKTPGTILAETALAKRTNSVFMGTNVQNGRGKMLVVKTGVQTVYGEIASHLVGKPVPTEFEKGIFRFGYLLSEATMALTIVVFAANVFFSKPLFESLFFSIALAVGLVPELLPAILSITLAKGARYMAKEGVITRHMESIENLGSMEIFCTDKTGTLTEGVVELDQALDIWGKKSLEVLELAVLNAAFQTGIDNPLDTAILRGLKKMPPGFKRVDEIPYDFERKRLSVVVKKKDRLTLICKGAFEKVLSVAKKIRRGDKIYPLSKVEKYLLRQRFEKWSLEGFRVLGLAYKEVREDKDYVLKDEADLIFAGFLLFFDPPKAKAKTTIAELGKLGVKLKIITGDNKLVARHVAKKVGLKIKNVLSGEEVDRLRGPALIRAVISANLFVEVDPNQKEKIILALRRKGLTVGYMGDGINDAPALHAADVGISVEKAVDVAKQAADFVLTKKDLTILRHGIVLGRKIFANTLKYIFVTTSANFGNMFSLAGAALLLPFLPLLPMQVLLINFISDFPAVAIASDSVDDELVRKPRRWNIKFIRNFMIVFGAISSIFDFLIFGALLFILRSPEVEFRTGWFVASVLTELFILLVIRTRRTFFKSKIGKYLWLTTLITAGVTLLLPYLPFSSWLGFVPLPLSHLFLLLFIVFVYLIVSELTKKIFYRRLKI